MMFARNIEQSINKGLDPFAEIRGPEGNFLKGADFISANLEGPITESKDCEQKANSFKFSPGTVELIAQHGINLVNLANNHTEDCGEVGFADTESYLSASKVNFFGDPAPGKSYLEKEINGKKIAFVGIDVTAHSHDLEQYYNLIKKLKEADDYVVINIHWGNEYHAEPSQAQRDVAHSLVDNGADLVVGHHPHVIQPVEIYHNKAIFYSLGNFIFDQFGDKMDEGLGVGTVFGGGDIKYSLFPFGSKNFQPVIFSSGKAKSFCDRFLNGIPDHNGCEFEIKY
jgi:poly-gamma-glutamate synthesis protein (capsule biosynthesis protein)